jgi:hypothetical protein
MPHGGGGFGGGGGHGGGGFGGHGGETGTMRILYNLTEYLLQLA